MSSRLGTSLSGNWKRLTERAVLCVLTVSWAGCGALAAPSTASANGFKTKNVVIVVADGERYTETWGDPERRNIPRMAALAKEGVVFTCFKNNGRPVTVPGHAAIATGKYEGDELDNAGQALPSQPSFMQVWLHETGNNPSAAWIICSKRKLNVLGDTSQADWKGLCRPSVDCADRNDSETFTTVLQTLKRDHPRMVLINLSAPDKKGHAGKFADYLQAIRDVDGYAADLWKFLQEDPFYADQTAFFLSNDHGRHSGEKFAGHGCDCEGCRHIMLMAMGPDFKKDEIVEAAAEQIDVSVTIAMLMGCSLPSSKGRVLKELFVKPPAEQPPRVPKAPGTPPVPDAVPAPMKKGL